MTLAAGDGDKWKAAAPSSACRRSRILRREIAMLIEPKARGRTDRFCRWRIPRWSRLLPYLLFVALLALSPAYADEKGPAGNAGRRVGEGASAVR